MAGRGVHNHSLRIQNRHFEIFCQSTTPFLCSNAASLGVGLGVRVSKGRSGKSVGDDVDGSSFKVAVRFVEEAIKDGLEPLCKGG